MRRYLYPNRVLAVLICGSPHLKEASYAKVGTFLPLVASTAAESTEADPGQTLVMVTSLSGFGSGFLDVSVHIVAGLSPSEIIQNQCGFSGALGSLVSPGQFKMKCFHPLYKQNFNFILLLAEKTFFLSWKISIFLRNRILFQKSSPMENSKPAPILKLNARKHVAGISRG